MLSRLSVIAATLLLVSGAAVAETQKSSSASGNSVVAATASGGPAVSAVAVSTTVKTRDTVRAEAVEAAKQHRSTFERDLDFFKN